MKKSICLYFQVHQPTKLRQYRFFDIGKDSHYYDDFANRTILRRKVEKCYLPMNELLLEAIKASKGALKVAFSISGPAMEQFDRYAPEVIDSFKALAETGSVEFLASTYYNSLVSLTSKTEFAHQVEKHKMALQEHFGVEPKTFVNTDLIYSDFVGKQVYDLGFKTMLTEGARHIMGWRSPDYIYNCDMQPKLRLLLRNYQLSDDLALKFSVKEWNEYPLTAEKYTKWISDTEGDVVNIFMDYETFGLHNTAESGIFEFFKEFVGAVTAKGSDLEFVTPAQAARKYKGVEDLSVPDAISWADEERDTTAWLGNELQQDAFNKLYSVTEKLSILGDTEFWEDFGHLQEGDNFRYMSDKFFAPGADKSANPYDSPYDAFINFMNVLSDFIIRVDNALAERQ